MGSQPWYVTDPRKYPGHRGSSECPSWQHCLWAARVVAGEARAAPPLPFPCIGPCTAGSRNREHTAPLSSVSSGEPLNPSMGFGTPDIQEAFPHIQNQAETLRRAEGRRSPFG